MSVRAYLRSLALVAFGLASISCATDGPLAPSSGAAAVPAAEAAPAAAPDQLLLGGLLGGTLHLVDTTLAVTVNTVDGLLHLLRCSALPEDKTSQVVGPRGGTLRFGSSRLEIPRGALRYNVRITAEQVTGSVNSVRFSPEGLQFAQPATLTMGYDNCQQVRAPKQIAYTDEDLHVLEVLRSKDDGRQETVTAPLNHFSRYAVSW